MIRAAALLLPFLLLLFSNGSRLSAQDHWCWTILDAKIHSGQPPYIDISVGLKPPAAGDTLLPGHHNLLGRFSEDLYDFGEGHDPAAAAVHLSGFSISLTDGPASHDWQWNAVRSDTAAAIYITDAEALFCLRFFIRNTDGSAGITLGSLQQTFSAFGAEGLPVTYDNSNGTVSLDTSLVQVEISPEVPRHCVLYQNYPNPFNPETCIRYDLPAARDIDLGVYNLLGQKVVTLYSGRQRAGTHTLTWQGRDTGNAVLPAGLYLLSLKAGKTTLVRKMILLD